MYQIILDAYPNFIPFSSENSRGIYIRSSSNKGCVVHGRRACCKSTVNLTNRIWISSPAIKSHILSIRSSKEYLIFTRNMVFNICRLIGLRRNRMYNYPCLQIFDRKNNAINMIINFIEEAMEEGQSVLVHSMHGKSRAGCVILAYLMKKYSWSLQKSFDYVVSKKDSFKIKSNFMSQLTQLEKRIMQNQNLSTGWLSASNQDDLVMLNTFKNVKSCLILQKQLPKKGKKRVSWG